jgi:uncharacterized damage-inducible protein DinB
MPRIVCLTPAILLAAAAATAAQPPATTSQPPATTTGQKVGLATSLQRNYAGIKNNLTAAADKLGEADYEFKPSAMAEVRGYGKLFAHVAQAQYGTCAAVKGVPNPNQGKQLEQELKTKADVVKALADSFAFCDDAFSSTTEENALQSVRQGNNEVTRAAALYGLIVHDNEMYGTASVYLRAKGIVPPSTEGRGRGRGGH